MKSIDGGRLPIKKVLSEQIDDEELVKILK